MPSAEIITIGTELLLGEIVDTNSQYLARQLRDAGIDIYWTTTVGDNLVRIAEAVRQGLRRSDIVVCTGGLGPTIDDMTREAIAGASGVDLEYREELWKQIQERFARFGRKASENNQRQAFVPAGAVVLDNPVGSAPAFLVQSADGVVLSLPGVPGEMKRIWEDSALPYLMETYGQSHVIRSRVLHSAGVGESLIDEKIADLEALANPTVGLAAHAGSVDIRLTAKAETEKSAQSMLDDLEAQVRERLGDWVYGKDAETLTETILTALRRLGWTLVVVEAGFEGRLAAPFAGARDTLLGSTALEAGSGQAELSAAVARQMANQGAESGLGAVLTTEPEKLDLQLTFIEPQGKHQHRFRYGGALQSVEDWALNLAHSWLLQQLRKAGAAE
jgi:competence/damage-inducible protein CinA-like protein